MFRAWRIVRVVEGFYEHVVHLAETEELMLELKHSFAHLHMFLQETPSGGGKGGATNGGAGRRPRRSRRFGGGRGRGYPGKG